MVKKIDEIRQWAIENVSYKKLLPETQGLSINKTIEDILESSVEEKFYMSEDKTAALIEKLTNLNTKRCKEPKMVGMIDIKGNDSIRRVYDPKGLAPTLTTMGGGHREPKIAVKTIGAIRIRKLTPRECWRLQGFSDEAFNKAQEVNSNSQLYKQAGNSVTVNVVNAIAENI